jgi:hypothetical protein
MAGCTIKNILVCVLGDQDDWWHLSDIPWLSNNKKQSRIGGQPISKKL